MVYALFQSKQQTVNVKTKSEELFERFCNQVGITCRKIPTESGQGLQSLDYEVKLSGVQVFAEVKQFDLTPQEQAEMRQLEEQGSTFGWGGEPGARARKKISDGVPQLKQRVTADQPAILVLYNNDPFGHRHIDRYSIMTAMYGIEQIFLEVPTDPARGARVMDLGFGPKRKLTPEDNTTLSAICVLYEGSEEIHLDVFHNIYAANRLDPNLLRHPVVRHFTLSPKELGKGQDWKEI